MKTLYDSSAQKGMSLLWLLIFFFIFLALLLGLDLGYIWHSKNCMDEDLIACVSDIAGDEEDVPEGAVSATGVISGEYGGENRSVTVTLNIPLEGGEVKGSFEGDCDGNIKGSYDSESGAISGKGSGSCAFVMPANGSFSGTVNKSAKTVPINGKGSVPGFSGEGSMTLTW